MLQNQQFYNNSSSIFDVDDPNEMKRLSFANPKKKFYFMIRVKGKSFADLNEHRSKLREIVNKSAEILRISDKEKITLKLLKASKDAPAANSANSSPDSIVKYTNIELESFEYVGVTPSRV